MMSKEFLKKLGIVGITFGLSASPLVLADNTAGDEDGEIYPEETAPGNDGNTLNEAFDTIEYENEEEEWDTTGDGTTTGNDWEEENEEEEWETTDNEWEEENEEEEWEDDGDTDQDF